MFPSRSDDPKRFGSIHCVNLAQGLKEPIIYYQQHPDRGVYRRREKGLSDIRLSCTLASPRE